MDRLLLFVVLERKLFLSKPENNWSSSHMDSENANEAVPSVVPKSSVYLRSITKSSFLSPYSKVSSQAFFIVFFHRSQSW